MGFIEETRTKPGKFGGPPPSASELYQRSCGEAWGEAQAAWDILYRAIKRNEEYGETDSLPLLEMQRNRADNAIITRLALNAIDRVFELSGGHGVYTGPLSRAYRDVKTAAQHIASNPATCARDAGTMLLNPDKPWPPFG
jgi:alkylation response protein AidB-like acyl-CoA dehydrogenase